MNAPGMRTDGPRETGDCRGERLDGEGTSSSTRFLFLGDPFFVFGGMGFKWIGVMLGVVGGAGRVEGG